jgi:hypothetical protein
MRVLKEGHRYELANFDEPHTKGQELQFIEKEPVCTGNTALKTVSDGTTNEEVLVVLIDRLRVQSKKLPTRETSIAITKCEEALMWLKSRTADRKMRGVEGTLKP